MAILEPRCSGDPVTAAGYITITADNQGLRYLLVVIKKLEELFEHGLGVRGVIGLLPQEQGYTEGGFITATENVAFGAHIVWLFRRPQCKGRQGPVGHGIAGGMAEGGAGVKSGVITSGARRVRIVLGLL